MFFTLVAIVLLAATALVALFNYSNRWLATIPGGLFVVFLIWSMAMVVSPGHARVGVLFGTMDQHVYSAGLKFVNPFMDFEDYSLKRVAIEFQSPSGEDQSNTDNLLTQSSDQVALTLDVTFAVEINERWLPWLYAHIGGQEQVVDLFLRQAARASVRNSTAQYTMEGAIGAQRQELANTMRTEFGREAISTLVAQGLTQPQAEQVFTFLPVQLRRVEPPARILTAQAEYAAAQRDYARAGITVQTAQRLSEARRAEGLGLRNLRDAAPPGWSANDIANVTNAQANASRAQALRDAVESNRVPIIITDGGGTTVQVPQQ